MYCMNCGKQVDENAMFCANCGTKLKNDAADTITVTEVNTIPVENELQIVNVESNENTVQMSAVDAAKVTQEIAAVELKASSQSNEIPHNHSASDMVLRKLIGKNADYYMSTFEKVKQGQKTKFMWSSLLFPIYFVLYRNCMPIFKSKYMIPAILAYVAGPVAIVLGALLPNFEATLVFAVLGSTMTSIGMLWTTVVGIQLGFKFPKLYYEYLHDLINEQHITEQNVDSFVAKYAGGNWKTPVILLVVIVLSATVSSAGLLMKISSVGGELDYSSGLMSEYNDTVSIEDDTDNYFLNTTYFINFEFDPPEYAPSVVFYSDGTFTLYDNYYSGIEIIEGLYELTDRGIDIIGEDYYFIFTGADIGIRGDFSDLVGFGSYDILTRTYKTNFDALAYNQEENQDLFEPYADQSYIDYEEARSILLYYLDLKYGFTEDEYEIYVSEDESGYVFEVYNWNVSTTSKNLGSYLIEYDTGNVYSYAIYVFDPEGALEFSPDWV